MTFNSSSRPIRVSLIGNKSISTPISKSILDAITMLSEEAEMYNATGMPSTPTLTAAWNVPAKSNAAISLILFLRSIGTRLLTASRESWIEGSIVTV